MERKDRKLGFIVEVKDESKMEEKSAEALQQIIDKKYAAPLNRYKVREIWLYGITFCDKECKVIAKRCEKNAVTKN